MYQILDTFEHLLSRANLIFFFMWNGCRNLRSLRSRRIQHIARMLYYTPSQVPDLYLNFFFFLFSNFAIAKDRSHHQDLTPTSAPPICCSGNATLMIIRNPVHLSLARCRHLPVRHRFSLEIFMWNHILPPWRPNLTWRCHETLINNMLF